MRRTKVADHFSLTSTVYSMKRRMECLLLILVSPWLPKYSLSKVSIKQIRRVVHTYMQSMLSWENWHTQELVCSLISSSWLWHPNSIVCLAQTCQAWLPAQQDWCLVRSCVSTAVFRRAIKIKVTAIAPLHETWVHQHFWTWCYKDGPPTAMAIMLLFKSFTHKSYYLWIH